MCFGGETQLFVLAIAFGILLRHIRKVTILYQIGVHELLMSIYDVQAMSYWCPNDTQVLTPSSPLTMGLSVVVGPLKQRAVLKTTAASPV